MCDSKKLQCIFASPCLQGIKWKSWFCHCGNHISINAKEVTRLRHLSVWFAKKLAFLTGVKKLSTNSFDWRFFKATSLQDFSNGEISNVQGFCSAEYYEVITPDNMEMHKIVRSLRCVPFRWHRTSGEPGILSTGQKYGHIPIASERGIINFVMRNETNFVFDKLKSCTASHSTIYGGGAGAVANGLGD